MKKEQLNKKEVKEKPHQEPLVRFIGNQVNWGNPYV